MTLTKVFSASQLSPLLTLEIQVKPQRLVEGCEQLRRDDANSCPYSFNCHRSYLFCLRL